MHHIKNVMRMQVGDKVICACDKKAFLCEISEISDNVKCNILKDITKNTALNGKVTIAQGLVRRDKTEEVVRRLTELGCTNYIPLIMKRSIIKIDKINDFKLDRYQKIIKEASEQSQRNDLMNISGIKSINDLIKELNDYGLVPQAGVAIGLAYMGARILGGQDGDNLQTIILASSVLYELVGPAMSKLGLYLSKSYSTDIDEVVSENELAINVKDKTPIEILTLKINQIREKYKDEKINPEEDAFNEAIDDYYLGIEEEFKHDPGNFINRRRR